ncbi:MAG: hypothetical protein NC826_03210 [Candidatus Omnitrophica bacterium]|nr:hypothetical protein [Candidatus Omnitrophota bacterium]
MQKYFIIFLVFLFFGGCASLPKNQEADLFKSLEPSVMIKFSDIPIPSGFKFLYQDSYSFQTSKVRVAILKYRGRPTAEKTFLFFKEQMPLYGWNLLNTIEYGRHLLNFEKENESCIITVEPKKLSTEFIITVGPKQTSLEKKETKNTK